MKYIEPIDLFENLALAKKLINDQQTIDKKITQKLIKKYNLSSLLIPRNLKERFTEPFLEKDDMKEDPNDPWDVLGRAKKFYPELF